MEPLGKIFSGDKFPTKIVIYAVALGVFSPEVQTGLKVGKSSQAGSGLKADRKFWSVKTRQGNRSQAKIPEKWDGLVGQREPRQFLLSI